ncbi:MAG TPA: nicotinate phosphoribosyltransferase [Terriglobales bacterium]|nr:nicotinate phosphoribosyltransferase [Terriglobales bacterium]
MPQPPAPLCRRSALLTDLYELTMAAAYFESGFEDAEASFELFVRALPRNRNYLLLAGIEQALSYLEWLRFEPDEIEYLRAQPVFAHISPAFFDRLRSLRFTGDVWAIAEGTPVFSGEPLLRVTAPFIEAQIVETALLSNLSVQTAIASKAARVVDAAQGRKVVEFGSRRAHGPAAAVLAARAAFIGGCCGTSNVESGFEFGIPVYGTLAHSFVMAHEDEVESFRTMERLFPGNSVLLVDTYDTLAAVDKIIAAGLRPDGVRLDSGNFVELAKQVRSRLDAAGLRDTRIFISGDMNEERIAGLLAQGTPVDFFGVGTELATSKDAPALSAVYKLVEFTRDGRRHMVEKLSPGKANYPGRKQVFRVRHADGFCARDVVACEDERCDGEPLLREVMRRGKRVAGPESVQQAQARAAEEIRRLPREVRQLQAGSRYEVKVSARLRALAAKTKRERLHRSAM